MPTSVVHPSPASHRESLATVRGHQAKAELRAQASASDLRDITARAIRRTHTKMQAAGDVIGVSESQIGRLINDGDLKLKHLAALGPEFVAELGRELLDTYGPLSTPKARAKAQIREARAILDELDQAVELIA